MGVGSVVATFVMCILFNILLPTGDVGSDVNLMYLALTFDLGDSVELEGCKSCYFKTEKEVYHPEENLNDNECKTCLFNLDLSCGVNFPILKKKREYEYDKHSCLGNESSRITKQNKYEIGECDANDYCCLTQTKETKKENPIPTLDPKKLFFPCSPLTEKLDYCAVVGKESPYYCSAFLKDSNFVEQFRTRFIHVSNSSANETVFFYPYSRINQTIVIEESNHSITDPDIKCGILFYRHKNDNSNQRPGILEYNHHCNEDVCRTHLKSLHLHTSITDLDEWRDNIYYHFGIKVGGVTCRLLQIYGTCILIPILLNLSFNMVLFTNDFRDKKANIFEVIPLIFFVYPQYKTIKFLSQYIFIHRDENVLNQDKEDNDRTVAPLEPFLESCLQVNTSIAILFVTEGVFPRNEFGFPVPKFETFNAALPLITFLLSLFAASFGMSKFFLSGPIRFLPNDSPFNGILSLPFFSLCMINSMFGVRIVCIESSFFSSYQYQVVNYTKQFHGINHFDVKKISPLLPPEYRLLIYLAPCIIPFILNGMRLWSTTKGLWRFFLKYPQFLISPCFTPFMFEGTESTNQPGKQQLKIWKWGTIINAIYIGCLPQCILCITDYYKGVHQWEFGKYINSELITANENNDALFKHRFGNTIFATITAIFFLMLITLFFGSQSMFKERGINSRCLTILCCPCPKPCIRLSNSDIDPFTSSYQNTSNENEGFQVSTDVTAISVDQPQTKVYLYSHGGESKWGFQVQWSRISERVKSEDTEQDDNENNGFSQCKNDGTESNEQGQEDPISDNVIKIFGNELDGAAESEGQNDTLVSTIHEIEVLNGNVNDLERGIVLHSVGIHSDQTIVKSGEEISDENSKLISENQTDRKPNEKQIAIENIVEHS